MAREDLLARTFVQLTDTLVDDFDIIDLLTVLADRCVRLVEADAVGILLADDRGNLRVMAASNEQTRLLELFQLQNEQGPCLEAFTTGEIVSHPDLRSAGARWPQFVPAAVAAGFGSALAIPLRLRTQTIGTLNLFRIDIGVMPERDVHLAQALADVASIAILQDQAVRKAQVQAVELQHALDSRVAIEQAKGMLAEHGQVDMDEAFRRMRAYARRNGVRLTEVAEQVVGTELPLDEVAGATALRPVRED